VVVLGAALGGCSGSDSGSSFVFGKEKEPPPLNPTLFPDKYKTEIADFLRLYLNNPTKVKDAYLGQPVLKPVAGQPQYITCVRYNARDTKGQYTGNETKLAIFLGGKMIQLMPGNPEMCANLAYQRFPEIENMVP
jgi:hypothetical protein